MRHLDRVLVTGGNGYIGSVLLRSLISVDIEVHALAHRNREHLDTLLPSDHVHQLKDAASLSALVQELQPDAIFHLASLRANSDNLDDLISMLETNLQCGTALLHGAAQCAKKPVFVNTGSYWQFGDGNAYSPTTFYAGTKQAFHDLLVYFSNHCKVPALTLVLFDSFGPDDPRSKLWTKLLQAPSGSSFPLTEGRQLIDVIHVDDIVRAFQHAATMLMRGEGLGRSFAVRSDNSLSLRQMIEDLQSRGLLDLQFEWGAIPYSSGQVFELWRGEVLPAWSPTIDVHSAIADWFRNERVDALERG